MTSSGLGAEVLSGQTAFASVHTGCWQLKEHTLDAKHIYRDVRNTYVLNINTHDVYSSGACRFSDFRPGKSKQHVVNCMVQSLYFECMARLCAKAENLVSRTRHESAHPSFVSPSVLGISGFLGDDDAPSSAAASGPAYKGKAIEFFLESVPRKQDVEGQQDESADIVIPRQKYTDYRFWILAFDDRLNMDDVLEEIILENQKRIKDAERNKGGRGRRRGDGDGATSHSSSSETPEKMWQELTSRSLLATLADFYSNTDYFSREANRGNRIFQKLTTDRHPLSASKIFGPGVCFKRSSVQAVREQSVHQWLVYFPDRKRRSEADKALLDPEESDALQHVEPTSERIVFPRADYVYHIAPEDVKCETLMRKFFPCYQQESLHPLLDAFEDRFPKHLALDAMQPEYRLEEDAPDPEDPALLLERSKRKHGEVDVLLDTEAEEDDPDKPRYTRPTRNECLRDMFNVFGFENLREGDLERPFNMRSLLIEAAIARKDYTASDIITNYFSPTACIEQLSSQSATIERIIQQWYTTHAEDRNAHLWARRMLVFHKDFCLERYRTQCRGPNKDVSEMAGAIHRYRLENSLYTHVVKRQHFDHTLSPFANTLILRMMEMNYLYHVADKHKYAVLMMIGRLNAYQHAFKLHFNMITHSPSGARSKTYLFELMERLSIPGTVEVLTYETLKANAVDGNKNDRIIVFNEIPTSMLCAEVEKGGLAESMFKERLTSMMVTAKVPYVDPETGKRTNRTIKSVCMGVWFGSFNDPPPQAHIRISEALRSRFYWGSFENTIPNGATHSMSHYQMAALIEQVDGHSLTHDNRKEMYLQQALVFEVEKLIMCGVLHDVTMHAAIALFVVVEDYLKNQGVRIPHARVFERCVILARTLAIIDGIDRLFFNRGAKYYGKKIKVKYLLELDRKLIAFTEHAVFALGLMSDQYIDPAEQKVMQTILIKHKEEINRPFPYWSNFKPPVAPQAQEGDHQNTNAYAKESRNASNYEYDYTYVRFGVSKKEQSSPLLVLAKQLHGTMTASALAPRTSGAVSDPMINYVPSVESIYNVLSNMCSVHHSSRTYIREKGDPSQIVEDPTTQLVHRPVVVVRFNAVHIHIGYLQKDIVGPELMKCAIRHFFHHKGQSTQRLLYGDCIVGHANLFDVLDVGPGIKPNGQPIRPEETDTLPYLKVPNVLFIDEIARNLIYRDDKINSIEWYRVTETISLDVCADTWAIEQRNGLLHITPRPMEPAFLKMVPNLDAAPTALEAEIVHRHEEERTPDIDGVDSDAEDAARDEDDMVVVMEEDPEEEDRIESGDNTGFFLGERVFRAATAASSKNKNGMRLFRRIKPAVADADMTRFETPEAEHAHANRMDIVDRDFKADAYRMPEGYTAKFPESATCTHFWDWYNAYYGNELRIDKAHMKLYGEHPRFTRKWESICAYEKGRGPIAIRYPYEFLQAKKQREETGRDAQVAHISNIMGAQLGASNLPLRHIQQIFKRTRAAEGEGYADMVGSVTRPSRSIDELEELVSPGGGDGRVAPGGEEGMARLSLFDTPMRVSSDPLLEVDMAGSRTQPDPDRDTLFTESRRPSQFDPPAAPPPSGRRGRGRRAPPSRTDVP